MPAPEPFNVLELFAGIGGLSLGLERAGMRVIGQVELDPYCRQVLAKHWPDVERHTDVHTTVEWWQAKPRPTVDLLAGGFPCQPASLAGRRAGEQDERWLWPAFLVVIRALRPRYVLLENVPGLLVRGAGRVLGDLAACGYDTEWDCLPAAAFGAPHRRDRFFAVAYPQSQRPGQGRAGRPAGQGPYRQGLTPQPLANPHSSGRDRRARVFRPLGRPEPPNTSRWAAEPDVGRVAHGIPHRVDRLRALGNAVVPAVAEHLGNLIHTHATQQRQPDHAEEAA